MADQHSASEANAAYRTQTSYKDRRKNYRREKKKLADELISAIQDPTIVVMSDWLKVRTTLKQWNKYFCELRPGSLYLYKSQKTHKSSNWIGSVMLKMCELIERPSKKNGFCFKLFHPLEHPIWSPKVRVEDSFYLDLKDDKLFFIFFCYLLLGSTWRSLHLDYVPPAGVVDYLSSTL